MNPHYDILIIGNGIIGCMSALKIANLSDKVKVGVIGPKTRYGSASVAAGAMLNVFGEIDYFKSEDDYIKRKLEIGCLAIPKWLEFLESYNLRSSVLVANSTVVYLKPDSTELEKGCFSAIKKASLNYKKLTLESSNIDFLRNTMQIGSSADFIELKDEMAISTPELFSWFDKKFREKKNIDLINAYAENISPRGSHISITVGDETLYTSKVLLAAGAYSNDALGDLSNELIPLLFGAGTAMQISLPDKLKDILPPKCVVRSPNRGSTCGIHIVPRENGIYYLGAGNFVTHKPVKGHRLLTIKYLLECFESDFTKKVNKSLVEPILGFRPISLDGKPMIGPLGSCPNIFVATGTKRDGLTYSPIIVDDIIKWFNNRDRNKNFIGWEPDRKLISYGDRNLAVQSYVDNKIGGLIEHNTIQHKDIERVERELRNEAKIFYENICLKFNLDDNFGIHPEVLNTF